MHPDPSELFRSQARIHLFIKQVRDRVILKRNMRPGTNLPNKLQISDKQQVLIGRDPKATDFRFTVITQEQQFGPGSRTEP